MKDFRKLNLRGKTILVRTSMDVPFSNNKILSSYRIQKCIPTIKHLIKQNAKIILIGHMGKERSTKKLKRIYEKNLGRKIKFCTLDTLNEEKIKLENGEILLLENLRLYKGEKKNSIAFSKTISQDIDYFIQDAFDTLHRKHASIIGIPKILKSYLGLNVKNELSMLKNAFKLIENKKNKKTLILGGAKKEKLELVSKATKIFDKVLTGGLVANNILFSRGVKINPIENELINDAKKIKNKKVIIPVDFILDKKDAVDIGPITLEEYKTELNNSDLVVWFGPLGKYEEYPKATKEIAKFLSKKNIHTIVGGGDSFAAIENIAKKSKNMFISTGGGATAQYILTKKLPGLEEIK